MLPLSSSSLSLARPHHMRVDYLGNLMTKDTGRGAHECSLFQPSRHQTPLPDDARAPYAPASILGGGAFHCHPSPRQVAAENTAVRQRVTAAAILKAEGSAILASDPVLGRGRR